MRRRILQYCLDEDSARESWRVGERMLLWSYEIMRPLRNVHPKPESSSGNTTCWLLEAIEKLMAQNLQQQGQQPE
ncbi:hypothetical protein FNV43_RR27303 [Rhamnella rubrinervis]|uniref:Uncharacterized protein n=1 Tax=Rhamnella rubrinervis TaxID=2594499 RepID=A0A8K0DP63_9ROSA|nr:hypothetical protein FNV43_RR27303 [Rhamnella rubrinervis]